MNMVYHLESSELKKENVAHAPIEKGQRRTGGGKEQASKDESDREDKAVFEN